MSFNEKLSLLANALGILTLMALAFAAPFYVL